MFIVTAGRIIMKDDDCSERLTGSELVAGDHVESRPGCDPARLRPEHIRTSQAGESGEQQHGGVRQVSHLPS
jgi:hypothetical protein